jgi:hypothetical protein
MCLVIHHSAQTRGIIRFSYTEAMDEVTKRKTAVVDIDVTSSLESRWSVVEVHYKRVCLQTCEEKTDGTLQIPQKMKVKENKSDHTRTS